MYDHRNIIVLCSQPVLSLVSIWSLVVFCGVTKFEISSNTVNDFLETRMKFLQRPVTTLKDSQRPGRWDRLEVYLSDH